MLYQINNGAVELGAQLILKKINFEIRNTEKIAVVGRNGCGKTTLLKLIAGEVDLLKRDSDEDIFIAKSGNPEIGYLKQIAFDDPTLSVDEEIRKVFRPFLLMQERMEELLRKMNVDQNNTEDPTLYEREIKEYTTLQEEFESIGGYYYEKEYDTMFRQFGFSTEDKYRPLNEFSGGQQTKIAFIKLLLSKPDILLLDEPTNHLDISTIEWLEDYLKNYKKAVVIVSHDRMFLDKVVDVVYEIEYKMTKRYPGNYTKFMETKRVNYEKQKKEQDIEIARLQVKHLKLQNQTIELSMTQQECAIKTLKNTEAYRRFKRVASGEDMELTVEDWTELRSAINQAYPDFLSNLQELYPNMSMVETRLCLLTKIEMQSSQIAKILEYSRSGITTARNRLYRKMFNTEGSTEKFNELIRGL